MGNYTPPCTPVAKRKLHNFNIRTTTAVHKRVKADAKQEGVSVSQFIHNVLADYYEQRGS